MPPVGHDPTRQRKEGSVTYHCWPIAREFVVGRFRVRMVWDTWDRNSRRIYGNGQWCQMWTTLPGTPSLRADEPKPEYDYFDRALDECRTERCDPHMPSKIEEYMAEHPYKCDSSDSDNTEEVSI